MTWRANHRTLHFIVLFADSMIDPDAKATDETDCKRKKGVLLPLVCGITIPAAYIGLLSRYLPDWLDAMIVVVFFGCTLAKLFQQDVPEYCAEKSD